MYKCIKGKILRRFFLRLKRICSTTSLNFLSAEEFFFRKGKGKFLNKNTKESVLLVFLMKW
jgi:hypothetical protein